MSLRSPTINGFEDFLKKDKKDSGTDEPTPEKWPVKYQINPERYIEKMGPIKQLYHI